MTAESCPDCGASLVVVVPARQAHAGSPAPAPDRGLSAASAPPILRCRDCDQYWVRHGARLDPI
jgi:hypothetical protein